MFVLNPGFGKTESAGGSFNPKVGNFFYKR